MFPLYPHHVDSYPCARCSCLTVCILGLVHAPLSSVPSTSAIPGCPSGQPSTINTSVFPNVPSCIILFPMASSSSFLANAAYCFPFNSFRSERPAWVSSPMRLPPLSRRQPAYPNRPMVNLKRQARVTLVSTNAYLGHWGRRFRGFQSAVVCFLANAASASRPLP